MLLLLWKTPAGDVTTISLDTVLPALETALVLDTGRPALVTLDGRAAPFEPTRLILVTWLPRLRTDLRVDVHDDEDALLLLARDRILGEG